MLVIAHRGASGHAPENTMAAFRKAVAQGATFIETDLQLSRDAHFVAIHDGTVNRTTNGRGSVHDLTLVELRELDAGSWFGSEVSGERIPTVMSGLLYDGQLEKPVEKAVEIGARQLAVRGDLATPALLEQARKKDLQVVCWTINQPAHMRLLIEAGVQGIMSDYPDRVVAALKKESETVL